MKSAIIALAVVAILAVVLSGAGVVSVAHAQAPAPPVPTGLVAADGAAAGTVGLTWTPVAVAEAGYYHIGWAAAPNVRAAVAAGRPWHEAFTTIAIANTGQSGHTVSHLVPTVQYRFIIGVSDSRNTLPQDWSEWTAPLTLQAGPDPCPADPGDRPAPDQAAIVAQLNRNATDFQYAVGQSGGSLTYATISEPLTFNIAIANDSSSVDVLSYLFEGLTEVSWLTDRVEPSLAESWDHSDDGLTWTFHLRNDVYWHDGVAFTAHDVAFTFNSVIYNDDIPASDRGAFTFRVPEGDSGQRVVRRITVTAVDDHTVRFELPTPSAPFLRTMTVAILPRHILEPRVKDGTFKETWDIQADPIDVIGTGPFTIAGYQPGQRITLRRNNDYWLRDADGNVLPYLDEIVHIIVPTLDAGLASFVAGEADFHGVLGRQYAELARQQAADNFTIHSRGPGFGTTFLALNMNPGRNADTGEPYVAPERLAWFQNRQFRRAVAHLIDKAAIIDEVQHGHGYPQWSSISPAAGEFYNPNVRRYEYSVSQAQAILDELGWIDTDDDGIREDAAGNPITFTMATNLGNVERQKVGAIIHRALNEAGIGAVYQISDFGSLVAQLTATYEWRPSSSDSAAGRNRTPASACGTAAAACTCGIPTRHSRPPNGRLPSTTFMTGPARSWITLRGCSITTRRRRC